MKIKTKKQLTLSQLIEWAWDNDDATGVRFQSDSFVTTVYFGKNGDVSVEDCSKKETFTVEVEEEITEDTEFKSMVEVTTDGLLDVWGNANISAWKDVHSKEFHAYIDGEFKCIWRNGKLEV